VGRRCALVALLIAFATLSVGTPAMASGPRLTVPQSELDAAVKCPIDPTNAAVTPVMFVTGTGASGDQGYLIGQDAFEAYGHPVCYVNFPDFTTTDIQISVQYLVYGLRKEFALAHRKIAVIGISQGGLLPRFALTYWPDLRKKVSDVVAAAGTQHGTDIGRGCSAATPCAPANWQQIQGSHLLRAINSQPDETPGNVSYTTVRSLTDQTVQPQGGKHPTSALDGASNILIQSVCPARTTTHIGTAVDSVTFAAFVDAVAHGGKEKRGAARVSRFPPDVCSHPYATGLNEAKTTLFLNAAGGIISGNQSMVPTVPAEPGVRKVFKRVPREKSEHKQRKRR
jgi:pimeloyl-ACP methyl ester carboxylesterase